MIDGDERLRRWRLILGGGSAAAMAALGAPAFACTPGLFPDLMAAAISRQDLGRWAAAQGIVATRA